jgi:acyl dehydratase
MELLYFEDFAPGSERTFGAYLATRQEIVAFAREFDPQPFHLDDEAGARSLLGGLSASGWHTLSMMMRLYCDEWALRSASMGSPAIEEARWVKPVRPGDTLSVRMRVLEARPSRSRPQMGLLTIASEVLNQTGDIVASIRHVNLMGRRGADWTRPFEADPQAARGAPVHEGPAAADSPRDAGAGFGWFEDVPIGRGAALGAYEFRADDMIRFARAYDPQSFHVDAEAAKRSHFGRLVASGWHTACGFMRRLVATRQAAGRAALARGEEPAPAGPSPGFRNLRWRLPVYAGDRLSYTSTVIDKRTTARPGWGLVFAQNVGVKENGDIAFTFESAVFYPTRQQP